MAFPIIPSGMFSGQGSTTQPNTNALGAQSSAFSGKKNTNLANAYDGDPNTYAEILATGIGATPASVYKQEVLYTHSPSTGLLSGSFLNIVINCRATVNLGGGAPITASNLSLVATLSGNYSDTTPISSASNPYNILYCPGADILSALSSPSKSYSKSFNGVIQISVDQYAPLTIDVYSLSLSLAWQIDATSTWNLAGTNTIIDARIYDISYIYL